MARGDGRCDKRSGHCSEPLTAARRPRVFFHLRCDGKVLPEDVVGIVAGRQRTQPRQGAGWEGVVEAFGPKIGLEAEVETPEVVLHLRK